MKKIARTWLCVLPVFAGSAFGGLAVAEFAPGSTPAKVAESTPTKWLRVVEDEKNQTISLEVASREYGAPSGQIVSLVGAVHIGDQSYYDALQKYLDSMSLVMWEGVKPEATTGLAAETDEKKITITATRLRLLAAMVERHKSSHGKKYPASLDDVENALEGQQKKLVAQLRKDAWDHDIALVYGQAPSKNPKADPGTMVKTMDLVSLGADGKEGGDGANADLKFSSQKPLSAAERAGKDAGIQTQLANALGLKFQLNSINYDRGNWRNVDMTAERLQQRMEEKGQELDSFMGMLDGSSGFGQLAGMLLRMIGASPQMQTNVKIMMLHTLSQSDNLEGMSAAAGMGDFMKVIVEDRNDVVMKDLEKTLKDHPELKTIGIFYGAGHFAGMEKTLVEQMHMTPDKQLWFPAITVDLKAAGMTLSDARQMKDMIRGMMDAQKDRMKKVDEGK